MKNDPQIILPCDCGCSVFVITKYMHDDNDIDYGLSVMDSYYTDTTSLKSRISRAFQALFGKPTYYNDVVVIGNNNFQKLIDAMIKLKDAKKGEYKILDNISGIDNKDKIKKDFTENK